MLRSRSLAAVMLGSLLTLAGCKQDIGERCEKSSDCSSGFCGGDSTDQGMPGVSKTCTPGRVTTTPDAGAPRPDAASDASDAASASETSDAGDAPAGDVAVESHAEAGEAGGDTAATDAAPEAGGDASAAEAGPDLGGDALTGDAAGN